MLMIMAVLSVAALTSALWTAGVTLDCQLGLAQHSSLEHDGPC